MLRTANKAGLEMLSIGASGSIFYRYYKILFSIPWRIANIKHIFDFGGLVNSSCCNHWCGYVTRKKKNTRAY